MYWGNLKIIDSNLNLYIYEQEKVNFSENQQLNSIFNFNASAPTKEEDVPKKDPNPPKKTASGAPIGGTDAYYVITSKPNLRYAGKTVTKGATGILISNNGNDKFYPASKMSIDEKIAEGIIGSNSLITLRYDNEGNCIQALITEQGSEEVIFLNVAPDRSFVMEGHFESVDSARPSSIIFSDEKGQPEYILELDKNIDNEDRIIYRNSEGELIAYADYDKNGNIVVRDESGKLINKQSANDAFIDAKTIFDNYKNKMPF